ncbi:MAG: hypothetical protein ACTJLK_01770 [Anaplasma sp.]
MDGEDIKDFFVRFRGIIATLVVLVLCSSTAVFLFETRSENILKQEGDAMYRALKSISEEGIAKDFASIANGKGISARLAKFRLAESYVLKKDVPAAQRIYTELAQDSGLARELRELAEYMSVVLSVGSGEGEADALESKLIKLASSKEGAYKSSAKETLVVLKLRNNDVDSAVRIMREILGDTSSNPDVRRNIESLLRVYSN